jgi:hypothetical protein
MARTAGSPRLRERSVMALAKLSSERNRAAVPEASRKTAASAAYGPLPRSVEAARGEKQSATSRSAWRALRSCAGEAMRTRSGAHTARA